MNYLTAKLFFAVFVVFVLGASAALAQSTAFTYQGKLTDAGNPASGSYDLSFKLYDLVSGGSQIGTEQIVDNANVSGGVFTVTLNFGSSPFTSTTGNFLEISVRPGVSTGSFTVLTPRQPITSSPYSIQTIRAASAAVADNANALAGVAANQFVQTSDPRLSDARPPTAGSSNYVQNSTVQQPLSNFNVSGTGGANIFDAATQYNIGGSRILSNAGSNNLFAGVEAGLVNTGGVNTFVGAGAGAQNTSGSENAFFGFSAGFSNQTGFGNSFFGRSSGGQNTIGPLNSFVGGGAGFSNTTGGSNSFFGALAGDTNTTGNSNTIVGTNADLAANNLQHATAIGADAVVSASNTVVLGRSADSVRIPGSLTVDGPASGTITNALEAFNASNLGGLAANQYVTITDPRLSDARAPTAGSTNYIQNGTGVQSSSNFNLSGTGTANILNAATQFNINGSRVMSVGGAGNFFAGIGTGQLNTGDSNAFVGALAGTANTTGRANAFFGAGAGSGNSTGDLNSFFGVQAGLSNTSGVGNSFFGLNSGRLTSTGSGNSFVGLNAGQANTVGDNNVFIGNQAGNINTVGTNNTIIGASANASAGNFTNATAIGSGTIVSQSNSVVLGNNANVGIGISSPAHRLHVVGNVLVTGLVRAPGGIFIANPSTIFITSPNGACWGITVSNGGIVSAFAATCP